jgi:hypothetical protein
MPVVNPAQVDVEFRRMEAHFWRTVAETLAQVLAKSSDEVAKYQQRLKTYREQLANAPSGEQVLVYHSEPLDVAADIAGTKVTPGHVTAYLELVHAPAA